MTIRKTKKARTRRVKSLRGTGRVSRTKARRVAKALRAEVPAEGKLGASKKILRKTTASGRNEIAFRATGARKVSTKVRPARKAATKRAR